MKLLVKLTLSLVLLSFCFGSAAFAVELDAAKKNHKNIAGKIKIKGAGGTEAVAPETTGTGGLFSLTLPDALKKDNLLETGAKLKNYLPPKEVLAEFGLNVSGAESPDGASSVSITDYIDKEKLLETAGKLKDSMPSRDELKDAAGLSDVTLFIDDTKTAAQAKIDELQTEANNLVSAEVWNERIDRYAADVKESEVVTGVMGKFDEVKEPIKEMVQNPGDTAVGRTVKSAKEYPKRLLIKIIIIVVIILVIVGIIKFIIAKITAFRNKMAVKAVKYVAGRGMEYVGKKRQAKAGADNPDTDGQPDAAAANETAGATASKPEELGEQALKYVLGLGVDQLNKRFNLNVQVSEKSSENDIVDEAEPCTEVVAAETVITEERVEIATQNIVETDPAAEAVSVGPTVKRTRTRMLRKQKSRPGKICP